MTSRSLDQNIRPPEKKVSRAERRELATAEWNNRTTGNQINAGEIRPAVQEPEEAPNMGGASSSAGVPVGDGHDMDLQRDFYEPMFDKPEVRVAPIPQAPSRQEALEHACTHCPFRSWCPHCVRGKAKSGLHMSGTGSSHDEVPLVAFDYAFVGERPIKNAEGVDDEPHIKILVGRDVKYRVYCAIPVPQKGDDADEYAVRSCLRFLDFLRYNNIMLKTDQEPALGAVMRK